VEEKEGSEGSGEKCPKHMNKRNKKKNKETRKSFFFPDFLASI
jgi:hypothetical protein